MAGPTSSPTWSRGRRAPPNRTSRPRAERTPVMNRREILAALATGAAAAATALPENGLDAAPLLPAASPGGQAPAVPSCGAAAAGWIPNVVVTSHENRQALFYNDLIRGKTVMINFMSI